MASSVIWEEGPVNPRPRAYLQLQLHPRVLRGYPRGLRPCTLVPPNVPRPASRAPAQVKLYFDGAAVKPFWKAEHGIEDVKPASEGGLDPHLAAKTSRASVGALVLGQVG